MGTLAAAGWAGSARGETLRWEVGVAGWAQSHCTASSWAQRAVRVDWGLSSIN